MQTNDPIPNTPRALAAGTRAPTRPPGAPGASTSPADSLDAALERLQAGYPSTDVHRSNHVPMVVEALAALGRAEAIAPWIEANLELCGPDTDASRRVDAENWAGFLGRGGTFPDWRELFLAELGNDDWPVVIRRWVPRLVPGLAGAATHGVIRAGHAVRSLTARDNGVRRAELATALAYWAVNFVELPWDGSVSPERCVADALARVQPRLPALEPPPGDIDTGLSALADTPSFLSVAGFVDVVDPLRTLGEMSSSFARLYLHNPGRRIAFAHTITAPSALRMLAPHLDERTVLAATRRAWQAAAGIYVVYGDPRMALPAEPARAPRGALVDACVANGGAHSIKLTEACLREEARTHDPILLAVARDAGESMRG